MPSVDTGDASVTLGDSVDPSIPATHDFYTHVNSGWLATRVSCMEKDGPFREARVLAEHRLDALIASEPRDGPLRALYDSYLAVDDETREALSGCAFQDELAACAAMGRGERIAPALAFLQRVGVQTPLELTISYEPAAAKWLPKIKVSKHWRAYDARTLRSPVTKSVLTDHELEQATKVEAALSAVIANVDRLGCRNEVGVALVYPAASLRSLCPAFPWSDWLSELGVTGEGQSVLIAEPDAVSAVATFLTSLDAPGAAAWFRLRIISARQRVLNAGLGPDGARRMVERFFSRRLAHLYSSEFGSDQMITVAIQIVNQLKSSLIELIQSSQWCSNRGRALAVRRISDMTASIGAAQSVPPVDTVTLYRNDVLRNVREASQLLWQHELHRVGQGRHITVMSSEIYSANGWYDHSSNRLCIGLGLLEPPFAEHNSSQARLFATLGVVVAHEMAHSLDLATWDTWPGIDVDVLRSKAGQLIEQCKSGVQEPLTSRRLHLDSNHILNETICDSIGLAVAEHAFRRVHDCRPSLSDAREFFLTWTWTMRATTTGGHDADSPHPPARERCNWALRNSDGYHWAFGTAPGDPMWLAPERRVKWWG